MQPVIIPAVKRLNRVFVPIITIGALAATTDIILNNVNIHPLSTKTWLACSFLSVSLVALFVLGVCTTVDQYLRLGYPFKDTIFQLNNTIWILWFISVAIINLAFITSAVILMFELTTHHLASLPIHHSAVVGKAAMVLAGSCALHALFTIFSLVIWYRNFNELLKNAGNNQSTNSRQAEMLSIAARGSGSLCELLLCWMFLMGGFIFTSLKLSNAINLHSSFLDQFVSIVLFATAALFLIMSFMGGHPPSECSRKLHLKASYFTKGFNCYLDKKFGREHRLSHAIEASPTHQSNTNINIGDSSNIIVQSSQLSEQTTIQQSSSQIIETRHEHKTPAT
jgi:hypothetical protein